MTALRVGSLCSGFSGIELGLALAGVDVDLRWVAEVDPDVSYLLEARYRGVPNLGDVKAVDWAVGPTSAVDLITAGFPCQPTSVAGRREGVADPRWLWLDILRAVTTIRPPRMLIENVRGLVSHSKGELFASILSDLRDAGYSTRTVFLGACHVGAAHHRHRVFVLAEKSGNPVSTQVPVSPCGAPKTSLLPTPRASDGAHGGPSQRDSSGGLALPSAALRFGRYAEAVAAHALRYGEPPSPTEPNRNGNPRLSAAFAEWLMRVPAGHVTDVLARPAALKAIGNGVCPPQAAEAWRLLTTPDTQREQVMVREDDAAEARKRQQARVDAVVQAVSDAGGRMPLPVAEHLAKAALEAVVDGLRATAQYLTDEKRKGHVSASAALTQAASHVVGYALPLAALDPADVPSLLATYKDSDFEALNAPAETVPEGFYASIPGSVLGNDDADEVPAWSPPGNQPFAAGWSGIDKDPFTDPVTVEVGLVMDDGTTVPVLVPVAADPFTDPAPRASWARDDSRRLDWTRFSALASSLKAEPSEHLSVSKIEALAGCGVKHALGKLANRGLVDEPRPQWAFIGGRAFHSLVEVVELRAASAGNVTPALDEGLLAKLWTAALDGEVKVALEGGPFKLEDVRASGRGKEGYDWWRVEGAAMARKYLDYHGDDYRADRSVVLLGARVPGEQPALALEREFVMPVAESVRSVHGFLDVAWHDGGQVLLVDLKTGSTSGSKFQLAVYTHALTRVEGVTGPILSANWLAREGKYTEFVDATIAHPWAEVVSRARTADAIDLQGLFMPNPSSFCGGCAHESICPSRQGV